MIPRGLPRGESINLSDKMADNEYSQIRISREKAEQIALELYGIAGKATPLPGELDFNFRLSGEKKYYILKVSRPDVEEGFINFQQQILIHIADSGVPVTVPQIVSDLKGRSVSSIDDDIGNRRQVRLLSWIDGRLWSSVNPQNDNLLHSLGVQAGLLTKALLGFDHPVAHRDFKWDLAQGEWTIEYTNLFSGTNRKIIEFFQKRFLGIRSDLGKLRKTVVHNDTNDNNVLVSSDLMHPEVVAIIDFGDAVNTQVVNDLAVALAYAIMKKPDPIQAALPLIKGYHKHFPLQEKELAFLYTLIAMRLVISVTASAINKKKEPENKYLLISEKPAWDLLTKWYGINEQLAYFSFRHACGFTPHPDEQSFAELVGKRKFSISSLFPSLKIDGISRIDMSVGSTWLGNTSEYRKNEPGYRKIINLRENHPASLFAGGYMEVRPFYGAEVFSTEGNDGPQYRTVHLGTDFWLEAGTPVHAFSDARVISISINSDDKDYGPTLILEHDLGDGLIFYSLYGHLSVSSVRILEPGQTVIKGELIAYVGEESENGTWIPHLHFQLMLDMLGNSNNFPGVAIPGEANIWKSICPDPNLLFKEEGLERPHQITDEEVLEYRKKHLGESLSLSGREPLMMLRGDGVFLLDSSGRRYLDTVNNVAHVGHEHPRVVRAGQEQMAVLNTNTRYLHKAINEFSQELLSTFPDKLSVVHVVNSGSEANELALRMARSFTGQRDIIAVQAGYHGNTAACVDISSYKFDRKGGIGAPEHTHIVPLPDAFRGVYRGEGTGRQYASHIQKEIENIQLKDRNIAAFICEGIISCGGQIELPEEYLKTAYEFTREAGGVCIADEVQVGCGRVGSSFWGFQLYDVVPDIVTIGKPVGNGHPLAVVVCTREVAEAFDNGMEYFNTFGGNPVSCTIGLEVLRVIRDEKLQDNALRTGRYLKDHLIRLKKAFPVIEWRK